MRGEGSTVRRARSVGRSAPSVRAQLLPPMKAQDSIRVPTRMGCLLRESVTLPSTIRWGTVQSTSNRAWRPSR